ncbi:hypothetical protein [Hyphomicrobium sp. 99]|uniref:hypothetical protein n=1 Tax=Hyphomicrobium sp. 99 TaxID=1163419 RepID=UPI0012E0BAF7|nr:hypothetical protein [Hyphomicrobium sp. 99]
MRNLKACNWLFLIPALILGPIFLAMLIIHGAILDRIYRARRWYRWQSQSARIIPIEGYVSRYSPRR